MILNTQLSRAAWGGMQEKSYLYQRSRLEIKNDSFDVNYLKIFMNTRLKKGEREIKESIRKKISNLADKIDQISQLIDYDLSESELIELEYGLKAAENELEWNTITKQ